jgi:CRISPR/Cas system-associated exonuclease Cas4 (RecB family)
MALPEGFEFSQNRLQDYADCPRRFQLRHVLMQPWPALIVEPPGEAEQHMQRGSDFHHLAHQHALGLKADHLAATIRDPMVARWWQTFLTCPPSGLPETLRRAEVVVAAPLAGYHLLAKFDLLAADPGERLVVVDWKTVLRPPRRAILAQRLQTQVYRFLAVEAGTAFNGGQPPQPELVEMIYWFANAGGDTERFPYDADQHDAGREHLAGLIAKITAHQEPIWPLTPDERRCRLCNYRSLCERGVRPAFVQDLEDDLETPEFEVDLEQVAEIEF